MDWKHVRLGLVVGFAMFATFYWFVDGDWANLRTSAGIGSSGSSGGAAPVTPPRTSNNNSNNATTNNATTNSTNPSNTGLQPLASGTFSVLSYNVAGLLQGISQSQPAQFIPLISPLLNRYDLVLAQEDFFYHSDLIAAATHPHQSTTMTGFATLAGDGLNRFSQFPFGSLDRQTWQICNGLFSNANDCLASKGFSMARHTIAAGAVIDVYNLHADAGGSSDDNNARRIQMAQLVSYIVANSTGNALIVAGDTNLSGFDPNDEPTLQTLLGGGNLTDSARFLGSPETIDRIMFRSSAKLLLEPTTWREVDEFIDSNGTPLSDHEAIHVDMSWKLMP